MQGVDTRYTVELHKTTDVGLGLAVGLGAAPARVVSRPLVVRGDRPVSSQDHDAGSSLYPAIGTSDYPSPDSLPYSIPGVGEKTSDTCGEVIRGAGCSVDVGHFWRPHPLSCDRRECPTCYDTSLMKVAKRGADRIRGFGDAVGDAPIPAGLTPHQYREVTRIIKRSKKILHVTISPPVGVVTPDMDYEAIQALGRDHARRTGLVGGYYIFHPYRISEDMQVILWLCNHALREQGLDTMSYWDHVHNDSLGLGSWCEYVEWSPHWHLIGVGWLMRSEEFHHDTGWIYKNIRPGGVRRDIDYDPKSVSFNDEIASVLRYQLSHAALIPGGRALREFGYMNTRYLKKVGEEYLKRIEEALCPVCQAPVVRYLADPSTGEPLEPDSRGGDLRPCFCKIKGWRYRFRFPGG